MIKYNILFPGVAEWTIAPGCRPGGLCACGGSNPSPWTYFKYFSVNIFHQRGRVRIQ
jgi:hypothetical protein